MPASRPPRRSGGAGRQAASAPPPRTRRTALVIAAAIVAALAVYAIVVALYAADQRSRLDTTCDPPTGSVVLQVMPESVDALHDRLGVTVDLADAGPLPAASVGFDDPVTVVVDGSDADRSYTIPAGTIPGAFAVSLFTDGEIEAWPFDAHTATARFAVLQTVDGQPVPYLPAVCADGQVPGWTLAASIGEGSGDFTVDGQPVPTVVVTATRSPATIAFGVVLLALLVTLPALGLTVAISAFRGRRKTEATLMSWIAAMLFATVPLRGFLPGSPPIGSWVDYLLVLWVVAGLVAALVVYVLAWLRWSPPAGDRPSR